MIERRPSAPGLSGWAAWLGYQFLFGNAILFGAGLVPFLDRRFQRVRDGLPHYLGMLPLPPPGPLIWVHGVSLGETTVACSLMEQLRAGFPNWRIGFTTTHPDVLAMVRKKRLADVTGYFPLDFAPLIGNAMERWRPRLIVLSETDFWPCLALLCRLRGIPLVLVNGRISEKHLVFWSRAVALGRTFFQAFFKMAVQTHSDLERLERMGADPQAIEVLGNIKFDLAPPLKEECIGPIRTWRGKSSLIVFGSLHPTEFSALEPVFSYLSTDGNLRLLIAPRDIGFAKAWETRLRAIGLPVGRRSSSDGLRPENRVLLLDTIGELASLYSLAGAAFIGGTLDPKVGGHNPLEAIVQGVPLVTGPHARNFADLIAQLKSEGGVEVESDPTVLARLLRELAGRSPRAVSMIERASVVLSRNQGALERTMAMIQPLLAICTSENPAAPGGCTKENRD